ncbi:hypothetical protein D3C87_2206970 [compost metagenome]
MMICMLFKGVRNTQYRALVKFPADNLQTYRQAFGKAARDADGRNAGETDRNGQNII